MSRQVEYPNEAVRAMVEGGPERDELEVLLADVRRIADGMDGIKALVVEGRARPAAEVMVRPSPETREVMRRLRGQMERAKAVYERNVIVHVDDIAQLLDEVTQRAGRT